MPVRLLLIEDNPGDAVIFREKIRASRLDAVVVHVVRLRDALARLEDEAFDLVLVDLSLPDTQGLETVERVREAAPTLPLIVLTGLDDAATAAEAKKRGAVDYLVKWYVDSASLARYIHYAIEQYRLLGPTQATAPASRAPAPAAPVPEPAPAVAEPAGDGAQAAPQTPVPALETAPEEAAPDGAHLVPALEAALAVATRTAATAEHLAGSLRAALDLVGGSVPAPEAHDVLPLVHQAMDRARPRALQAGIPVRLRSDRKKVIARTDRQALGAALDRLLALALDTGCASGVRFDVAVERGQPRIAASWELRRGAPLSEPDDPLLALDLALCRRLAARAGGDSTLRVEAGEAVAVLALDAAAHA